MHPQNAKKILIILGAVLIILIGILSFTFLDGDITGQTIQDNYTYTTAVCDENNFCEDYEVTCKGKEVLDISPTGFTIQNPENWEDPRDPENIENLCNISE